MNHWDRLRLEHRQRMNALIAGVLFGVIVGGLNLLSLDWDTGARVMVLVGSLALWGGACRVVLR